jgi:NTE family protein
MRSLLIVLFLFVFQHYSAQKVGVVLSGGGATALAHVGFLKVLEDNEIPIDYIGGTSMGSVIAGMYASGYSVAEIDSFVRSEPFMQMVTGQLDDDFRFYFKDPEPSASMGTIKYSKGTFITNAIPTNLIDPVQLDWNLMSSFSQADQASGSNFDSLYIPFRCIAADVKNKREITFKNGPLNVALRASSTYPFYLPPRRVDGVLLFDGGIYNNFPVGTIYREFAPDVILGCNVSGENSDPSEGDLFSQLESMILFRNELYKVCDELVIIEPKSEEIGTFDFDRADDAIEAGYKATMDSLSIIFEMIQRRESFEEKQIKRQAFKAKFAPLEVDEISINGLDKSQNFYVKRMMSKRIESLPLSEIRESYFRLFSDDKIKTIFPTLHFNPATKKFRMNLDVEKEKDLFVSFGGNFSSRSINAGFVGLRYNLFGKTSATISANSYFGRFYASILGEVRWDLPGKYPLSFFGAYTQNRWDYYKSLTTFFDDVKPSFVLLNERTGTAGVTVPAGNKGKLAFMAMYSHMFDEYYQTQNFISTDTADRTDFDVFALRAVWQRSTLDRIQYAHSGTDLMISAKYMNGLETTIPGSTLVVKDTLTKSHQWFVAKFHYTNYFLALGKFHGGFTLEHVWSNQDFFNNYISTAIMAPSFKPIPESKTFFLTQFRAFNYSAAGLMAVYEVGRNLDLRAEAYGFGAYNRLESDENNQARFVYPWRPYFMGSTSLVFHSPLGPISVSANYYERKEEPWSLLFNFGYIIFNRSIRD